jgi:hypothetical protein
MGSAEGMLAAARHARSRLGGGGALRLVFVVMAIARARESHTPTGNSR